MKRATTGNGTRTSRTISRPWRRARRWPSSRKLPELRAVLALDVQAAFEGDPACRSFDEVIFCYPGLEAVTVYRLAHVLHELGVPLIPRMMTEWAHSRTGVDIHPGARSATTSSSTTAPAW